MYYFYFLSKNFFSLFFESIAMQQNDKNILLSTAFFPPISYIKHLIGANTIYFEQHENYIKQSYRNRCKIYAANGVMNLSVPVVVATRKKVLIRDVQIDYATNWQKQHFKSIESAYRSSPFYEYLVGDFESYFEQKHKYLFDYNLQIINTICSILDVSLNIQLTETYQADPADCLDLRNEIHPKDEIIQNHLISDEYPQVFSEKHGFEKDLSILDLLFNLGSDAYSYLIDKYSGI